MKIMCKCLNVTIFSQDSGVRDIDLSSLNLTSDEENDTFFKEDLRAAEHGRISKVQSSLVEVRNVGLWIIHCCLNCATNTHAIHREKGAAIVLFNKELLVNPEEIQALRNSEQYSSVFRIVIDQSDLESAFSEAPTKFAVTQLPPPIQIGVSALQQQLTDMIQIETTHTEERVRWYSEQQYVALEELRERAHHDYRLLIRLLCNTQEKLINPVPAQSVVPEDVELPRSALYNNVPISQTTPVCSVLRSPASIPSASQLQGQQVDGAMLSSPAAVTDSSHSNQSGASPLSSRTGGRRMFSSRILGPSKGQKNRVNRGQRGGSFDSEGLFDLEGMGMDDNSEETAHSEEEPDSDESGSHDEGIHIPRDRGLHNLAKSLPVNVPSYMPPEKRAGIVPDENLPQDPMDIAASIKALARSVHGDANVFGDLPRPRFSTQI